MRWPRLERQDIEEEGRRLVERLGGRWSGGGGLCRCPAHDDRNPSLSIRPGRTRLLVHCFAGCDPSAVLGALRANRLLETSAAVPEQAPGGRRERGRAGAPLRLWTEARPIAGTPAAAYLRSRGLDCAPAELRYHPRTPHGRWPLTQFRPALVAALSDDSGLVAVHRTFLAPDGGGLAPLASPRCGLGRFGRGAVRVGGAGPRLGLAEGIETALSATALFGIPCWATLGAERFGRVALPAEVRELLLFLDHDQGGRRAEQLARSSFAGVVRIEACVPDRPGEDWNDVLRRSARGAKD